MSQESNSNTRNHDNQETDSKKKEIQPNIQAPEIQNDIPEDEKPTGNFYRDLEIFFKQLSKSFKGRYALWENTFLSCLKLLRVIENQDNNNIRKIEQKIEEFETQIKTGFQQYQLKLKEVERYSDMELTKITQDFKDTLDLLRMEVQEYMLQKEINTLFSIYQ